jgi:hypothetical protein
MVVTVKLSKWWLQLNNFPIVNLYSNIPAAPAYDVYISQLIHYSRACGSCRDFLDRRLLLTRKPLIQGFLLVKLKSSLRKFYGHHHLWPLWNICVIIDHGYIPLVNTSWSFPDSWHITRRINWEIYTSYAGAAGMLLYMNGKFTMGLLISSLLSYSFVLSHPSLSISRCRSKYLWYPLLQALWDRCEIWNLL